MSIYKGNNLIVGRGVDTDLIRNLHDPDWAKAVSITAKQLVAGYTTPGRGIVVGWVLANSKKMYLKVNGVEIGTSVHIGKEWASYLSIQVPVNKNDVMTVTQDISSTEYFNMSFVPYKAQ